MCSRRVCRTRLQKQKQDRCVSYAKKPTQVQYTPTHTHTKMFQGQKKLRHFFFFFKFWIRGGLQKKKNGPFKGGMREKKQMMTPRRPDDVRTISIWSNCIWKVSHNHNAHCGFKEKGRGREMCFKCWKRAKFKIDRSTPIINIPLIFF